MSITVIVFLICLFTGGALFFSAAAMALRTFSRVRLQDAFKAINKENLIDKLEANVEKLVLACSLCRIIFNMCILLLLVAAFMTARAQGREMSPSPLTVNHWALLFAFVIAMPIFLVFSLAIPHAWAKYGGERILSRTYGLLVFFAALVCPILYVLKFTDALVRRLSGVTETTREQEQEEKQEEFLTELDQRRMAGVVDEEEQEMIENVLELSDSTADEIMTPRTDIVAVEANSDLQTVLDTVIAAGHSRVPVYEDNIDNIVGLIYAKDLLTEVGKSGTDFKLCEKMRDAYFVPETKPLRVLLHEFQNQKQHIAVVLDEYGGTAGIVTIEDILEELVGEITDEYEKTPPKPVRKIDQRTIEADARTYIDDLNDDFELNLPEDEDYDTVGGFVFSHLGYIPKTGATFDYKNLKFTIRSAEARRIKRIRIQRASEQ